MQRKASANWQGALKSGNGSISTSSKVLSEVPFSFGTRFEEKPGTNPEELVAAAHAACFSMALAAELEKQGIQPASVMTDATATLERQNKGWRITEMHLDIIASAPNLSAGVLQSAAAEAKVNCPISRLINTKVTLNAQLAQKAA